jgi:putative phosphoesterase
MRLGIISDTHGLLRPEVFELFRGVDHILHAGDIGSLDLLTELETLAPVSAVYGNTDDFDVRARVPEMLELELEGIRFVVVHGHQLGVPTPERLVARYPDAEVIVFGHTHKPVLTMVDQVVTVMNPGGAGARRFGLPASAGIMELEAGLPPRARLVPLTELDEND